MNPITFNGQPNPYIIMQNFQTLAGILNDVSILLGLCLLFGSMFAFKRYGESRTYMSAQQSIAGPMLMMLSGIMLLMLPTIIQTIVLNFWGGSSDLQYPNSNSTYDWTPYMKMVLMFVRLIGVGAMIRGIYMFSRAGGHHSQPGMLGKGVLHLVGGMFCIHILGTWQFIENVFDLNGFL